MLRTLFDTYDYDRCLIGSVLERHQAGLIFCDDTLDPQCAVLYHPGDYGYLAGDPESGDLRTIIEEAPGAAGVAVSEQELLVPRSTSWIARCGRPSAIDCSVEDMSTSPLPVHGSIEYDGRLSVSPVECSLCRWTLSSPDVQSRKGHCRLPPLRLGDPSSDLWREGSDLSSLPGMVNWQGRSRRLVWEKARPRSTLPRVRTIGGRDWQR